MNNDLISRSALLEEATNVTKYDEGGWDMDLRAVPVDAVENAPAVDAVEVVRCKDCKHFRDWGDGNITCHLWTDEWDAATVPDAFCSYGERRADHED